MANITSTKEFQDLLQRAILNGEAYEIILAMRKKGVSGAFIHHSSGYNPCKECNPDSLPSEDGNISFL